MPVKSLPPIALIAAEQVRFVYRARVQEATDESDLLSPVFWAHVANKLRFGAKIEVLAEEGTWYQEFIVIDAGANWAKVAPIMPRIKLVQGVPEDAIPEGYDIQHKGPELKYVVDRKSDAKRLSSGFATKGDAIRWLAEHVKNPRKAA